MFTIGCLRNPSANITLMWAGQFAHLRVTRCPEALSTIHLLLVERGKEVERAKVYECDASRACKMKRAMINSEEFPVVILSCSDSYGKVLLQYLLAVDMY